MKEEDSKRSMRKKGRGTVADAKRKPALSDRKRSGVLKTMLPDERHGTLVKTSAEGVCEAGRMSEKQYRTLLDFVPYPIVVFTLYGKVNYLNPAFTETFGWSLEELRG